MLNSFLLEISGDILILVLALACLFAEIFLHVKFKNKLIRLIPSFVFLLLIIAFFISIYALEGWDAVGALILMIYSLIFFIGTISLFLIWWLIEAIINKRHNTNSVQ